MVARKVTLAEMLFMACAASGVAAGSDPGAVVARGSGPFEVSGSAGSLAVAWLDAGSGAGVLSIAVIDETARVPIVRRVSETAQAGERILLSRYLERVAVAWRERGRWHLGLLRSTEPGGWTETTLRGAAVPIALSLGPGGLVVLISPATEKTEERMDGEDERRGFAWPALSGSALLRVDPASREIEVIHEFDEVLVAGALRFRERSWSVAGVGRVPDAVRYAEIDPSGRVVLSRRLSAAPEPGVAPELQETAGSTVLAWVERSAGRRVALLGRIGRGEADLEFRERTLGAGEACEVRLSEGGGPWAAWREQGGAAPEIRLSRLDGSAGAACSTEVSAEGVERFWLLDGGEQARLIVQTRAAGGASELRVRDVECAAASVQETTAISDVNAAKSHVTPDFTLASPAMPLGGVEEPCDGRDNDGDGYIDEGCDGICDSPEKVGTDVRVTSNASYSEFPSVVWTGSQYGVAWQDNRDGNYEIYFARLDASGNKIGGDVRVTNNPSFSLSPALVWTGSEYGVAWEDLRDGNLEIYFARIDAAGTKIGSDVRVTTAAADSRYASLVWAGGAYGVAWTDGRDGNNEIYFARIDAAGSKIGSDLRVTNAASDSTYASLVWTGSAYGVAWQDNRDGNYEIYLARIDAAGNKIGADVRVTNNASGSGSPSLAWTGSEYGVAWDDLRDGNYEIYVARLDAAGSKIGPDARVTNSPSYSGLPSLVWTGSEYGVAWRDQRDGNDEIYLARLDAADSKIGPDLRMTSDASFSESAALIWTGTEYGMAWRDDRDGNAEIYVGLARCCDDADADGWTECAGDTNDQDPAIHPGATEICDGRDNDSDGTIDERCDAICDSPEKVGSEVRLTNDPAASEAPSLVWTGSQCGVAWVDYRDGNGEIYFARLDSSGTKIGPDVQVTSAVPGSDAPYLVWTGSEYGVSWQDFRDGNSEIYFARLSPSGAKIGADVRVTNNTALSYWPSLVWTGSGYGVSWQDFRDGNLEIYFARLDASGNKIGVDIRVTTNAARSFAGGLAWTGSQYGVTWLDERDGHGEIYFATLDASGSKIGSDVRVTNDPSPRGPPKALVWTGTEYGLAWSDSRDGNYEIYFARLNATGTKIGSDVRVTSDPSSSGKPSLTWTGSEYGVSWDDARNEPGYPEIYFARLDSSGAKIGSDVRVTNDASASWKPILVWTGNEYGVSWYDARDGDFEIYVARVRCCDDADADGWTECAGDTNDRDPAIHPGAPEICDGRDNDGDGTVDEGCDAICDSPEKLAPDVRATNDTAASSYPSLVWTGSGYGVAWQDNRDGNNEIYFARIDAAGNKIGADVRVTNAAADSSAPFLVWTGSEYGVAWQDDRDGAYEIYFARLDPTGNKLGTDVRLTSHGALGMYPSLAWTGSGYGVAWEDGRNWDVEIYFARLDAAGTKVGADVRVTYSVEWSYEPSLVWTGSGYGVSWMDCDHLPCEVFLARLDAAGIKIGADTLVANTDSYLPSLVWTGSEYGLSWQDYRNGYSEIYFARVDASGTKIGADLRVTNDAAASRHPSSVWTGSEYGVSWQDNRDGDYEIYFARVDASGTKIGADVRLTNHASGGASDPSVVWTGSDYGVAWIDSRDGNYEIYFARVRCCDNLDGDAYNECHDCNDADGTVWGIPGEVPWLGFLSKTRLYWTAPTEPGCLAPLYDTVRSGVPLDFTAPAAVCVESDDASDVFATDVATPASRSVFFYLVRAENSCGDGPVGLAGSGLPRVVRSCP